LPSSAEDFLPPDHLVRGLRTLVEENFGCRLRALAMDRGGIPHDPVGLFGVWLFGMMQGERSSRRLEELCRYDVRYAHLCAGVRPDHSTLARFRERLADVLPEILGGVCDLAKERGFLKGRVLAVDGTKVPGVCSQWQKALGASAEVDARTMVDARGGYVVGYNVQVAGDVECGLIVACPVTNQANDADQMGSVLEAASSLRVHPDAVIADAGYDAPKNFAALEAAGVGAYIVPHPKRSRAFSRDASGILRCPAGHEPTKTSHSRRGVAYDTYRVSHCRKCFLKTSCGTNSHQKEVSVQKGCDPAGGAERAKAMSSDEAQRLFRLRGPTIERIFAELKAAMRFQRFNLRNLRGAQTEILLLATAYNLRKLLSAFLASFAMLLALVRTAPGDYRPPSLPADA
jgi:transposase